MIGDAGDQSSETRAWYSSLALAPWRSATVRAASRVRIPSSTSPRTSVRSAALSGGSAIVLALDDDGDLSLQRPGRRARSRTSAARPRTTSSCSFVSSRQTATRRSPSVVTISSQQAVAPFEATRRRRSSADRGGCACERRARSPGRRGQEALEREPIGREPGQDEGGDRGRRAGDDADVDASLHRQLHDPVARDRRCSACRRR